MLDRDPAASLRLSTVEKSYISHQAADTLLKALWRSGGDEVAIRRLRAIRGITINTTVVQRSLLAVSLVTWSVVVCLKPIAKRQKRSNFRKMHLKCAQNLIKSLLVHRSIRAYPVKNTPPLFEIGT